MAKVLRCDSCGEVSEDVRSGSFFAHLNADGKRFSLSISVVDVGEISIRDPVLGLLLTSCNGEEAIDLCEKCFQLVGEAVKFLEVVDIGVKE